MSEKVTVAIMGEEFTIKCSSEEKAACSKDKSKCSKGKEKKECCSKK